MTSGNEVGKFAPAGERHPNEDQQMMARKPIDPFARKMIYGALVYGGIILFMFGVLSVVYLHTRPRCSDRVVAEAASPDKRWTATIMERRCGEDTPFFTHVNLRPAGNSLHRGFFSGSSTDGEVFMTEQDAAGSGVTLNWTAPDTLTIQCPRCSASLLRKHDQQWNGILLKYDLPSRQGFAKH
jgi:hypothetical protein